MWLSGTEGLLDSNSIVTGKVLLVGEYSSDFRELVEAWGLIRETFVDPTFNHQASHANGIHHQQQPSNPPGTPPPIIPPVRSSNSPRGLATSQSDQSGGFFNFPPPGPSSQKPHETENSLVSRIHLLERNHLPHPVVSFDWDSVWGLFRHAHGGSSTNRSASFCGRHRS